MIIDFLRLDIPEEHLKIALEVLKKFKECESAEEWIHIPFFTWMKLEQLEEFLEHRVNGVMLKADTIKQIEKHHEEPTGG